MEPDARTKAICNRRFLCKSGNFRELQEDYYAGNYGQLSSFAWVKLWLISTLTHLHVVPHICIRELGQHWSRKWLVACWAPSHYPNQCWLIVNYSLQWNSNQNTKVFIHKNAFQYVVSKMVAILFRQRDIITSQSIGCACQFNFGSSQTPVAPFTNMV